MLKYTKKKGILLKMSMFAIISTYKKNLDEVDKKREEHLAYVKNFILSGKFLVVGRKNPIDGAVIIAHNVTKKELEEGKGIVSAEDGFQMKLVVAYHMQQSIYSAGAEHYPLANVSTQADIKNLKINGQAVDEVKEYVDADGHTWYLWYFKNLKLKEGKNVVSFD